MNNQGAYLSGRNAHAMPVEDVHMVDEEVEFIGYESALPHRLDD